MILAPCPDSLKLILFPNPNSKKILAENTTIIAYEINKLQLQILEALHVKTKKCKILKIATMFKNALI